MCDICVMNSVKERMLSRRHLFKGTAAGVAAAAIGTAVAAPPALAAGHGAIEDLTHTLNPEFPTYFGVPGVSTEQKFNFAENGFNLFEMTVNEHTGTHIDAPFHFSADGQTVDQIPVGNLIVPLCVVDIAGRAQDNPDAEVTPDDIKAWIAAHGDIPDHACIALHSGWAKHVGTDKFRGADADGVQHYPGFHVEATTMLMEETGAVGLATDTLSTDLGMSSTFPTHYAWLPSNRYNLENVANLDKVPASGATLIVGAPKHEGGSGGPCRLFAMI